MTHAPPWLGALLAARPAVSGSGDIAAPFTTVNGPADGPTAGPYNGWSVTYAVQPALPIVAPVPFTVTRQGFDTGANAVTVKETMYVPTWVRQPFPNQALASLLTAAPNDYIYSTDVVTGAVNNSTKASPKPVFNWVSIARSTVGNIVHLAVTGTHRNARNNQEVACVKFIASDGVNPDVSQVVSVTSIDVHAGDMFPVIAFVCDLDITTLNAGLITVNAEVYPWIGAAASVFKSVDQTADALVLREFGPRYFLKNVAKAAAPPLCYVSTTGSDATHAGWSTNAVTAAASPYLTIQGAINDCATAANNAVTGGVLDGCVIRVTAGTFNLVSALSARAQNVSWFTITRDPLVLRTAAIITLGGAGGPWRARIGAGATLTAPITSGAVRFNDITFQRPGNFTLLGEAATRLNIYWDDVTFDNNNFASYFSSSDDYIYGMIVTNMGSGFGGSTSGAHRIFRGLNIQNGGFNPVENWINIGGYYQGVSNCQPAASGATSDVSGGMFAFSYVTNCQNGSTFLNIGVPAGTTNGFAFLQNVGEYVGSEDAPTSSFNADTAAGNSIHICIHNNTMAGSAGGGRDNWFYDWTGTARTTDLMSTIADLSVQINTKSDIAQSDGTRLGNWAYEFGVGCVGILSSYAPNAPASESQTYPGIGAQIGGSTTVRNPDPLFTNFQAQTLGVVATATMACVGTTATISAVTGTLQIGGRVTGAGVTFATYIVSQSSGPAGGAGTYILSLAGPAGPIAATFNVFIRGAGNGVYTLQGGSPAKNQVNTPALAFDLAANVRPSSGDSIGAYV